MTELNHDQILNQWNQEQKSRHKAIENVGEDKMLKKLKFSDEYGQHTCRQREDNDGKNTT